MKAAKQLGYVYNQAAANLRRQSSSMIGMVINDLTNPFFAELAGALERSLTDSGYVVMMANTSEDRHQQDKVIRTFCEHGVAGILICPVQHTQYEDLAPHILRGTPMVSVMRPIENSQCDYIAPDNYAGTFAVTQHLIEQGITALTFLGGLSSSSVYQQRLNGFMAAIEQAGLNTKDVSLVPCEVSRAAAAEAIKAHVVHCQSTATTIPQGIVCYNDIVAFGVNFGLNQLDIKTGQDITITGFDDVLACSTTSPPLTSVHVFTDQLAKLAAQSLLQRLKDPDQAVSNQSVLPKVIVRASSQLS